MQNFDQTFLILSARDYRIVDKETGEVQNEGISFKYLATNNLLPIQDDKSLSQGSRLAGGHGVAKATLPITFIDQFKQGGLPGLYKCSCIMKLREEKHVLDIVSVEFAGQAHLTTPKTN